MPSIFTRIIDGELPGRFVWRDDRCVAFLTINPLAPGHTLVVPREEVDHWLDADDDLMAHLLRTSRAVGTALQQAFPSEKVAMVLVCLEVPHLHLHLIPIDGIGDVDFTKARRDVPMEELQAAASAIRAALG